ncbi:GumC family protein [Iningainema tapete]|uniref:non-specific protein-tyrosine kinase n=1 Tax=Iningainema tapete BLCC-T55 TaxID=2748662 RepID=A0A8J6XMU8_9CYAN|nr:polysaccharide biosynthesis tyrosine autokinase [Iningainema tapete]MBD2773257.1 polysaccharide biosynthesis tyrosine autokinase [Iningainema tapete BLCC-T55]
MDNFTNAEEIDLQKYLLVLQRRWMPAVGVFGVVLACGFLYTLTLKPTYKAEGSLLIKSNHTSALTGLGESIGKIEPLTLTNNPLDTQAKIVTSIPVIQETIAALNLRDKQGKLLDTEALISKLKVTSTKGTEVLEVSYTDNNPKLAAKVVNKVMSAYIKNNIEANRAEAVAARTFVMQQLPRTELSVKEAELALRKFKEDNNVIALQEEANIAVNEISRLEQQVSQAQTQLSDANARSQKLQNQAAVNSQQAVTFASLSQIPGVQQILTQLQEAQSQLAVARTIFQPQHPTVLNLEEKVTALNSLLQQRIEQVAGKNQQIPQGNLQIGQLRQKLIEDYALSEAQRVGLEQQISTLSSKLSAYRIRANVLPKLEQTQRELERKLKASQTTYESLLTKLQEIQVAENQNIGNARVVSPALVPNSPEASRKMLVFAGAGVLGIILGIIAAFSLDLTDRSVKTVKEARELFGYTLLGVIPSIGRSSKKSFDLRGVDASVPKVIGRDIPQFPVGDVYQMLQANLKFLSSDTEIKAIAVTSSVSKEGKSEVSANLAVAMAQVGRKVLLVDADMRHPIQHHIWEKTNAIGLSNVLIDVLLLDQAIHEVMPNLHVLTSGVVPPNPVALLDSKRMAALVDAFAQEYDFVIFDTPQLSGTADAAVLGNMVDGMLLVVRPGVVDVASANATKEFLRQSGQNVLGMVVNGVNTKNEPDSYFYYTKEQAEPDSVSLNSLLTRPVSSRRRNNSNVS